MKKNDKKFKSSLTPNQKIIALEKIKKGLNRYNEFMCLVYGEILGNNIPNNTLRLFDDIPELYLERPDKSNDKNSAWNWKDKPEVAEYINRKKKAIDVTIKLIKDKSLK